jgi:hypothetical protein
MAEWALMAAVGIKSARDPSSGLVSSFKKIARRKVSFA